MVGGMARTGKNSIDVTKAVTLYQAGSTVKQVAGVLGSTYHSTRKALQSAGVLRRKGGKAQLDETALVARYDALRSSERVATEFGCTPELVLKLVRAAGGETAKRGGRQIYDYDRAFFDEYTPESCYWAGFIAADGGLVLAKGAHRLQIMLGHKDRKHLEAFTRCAGSDHPVKDVMVAGTLEVQLTISSKRWWDALHAKFNLTPRKSLTLKPPPDGIPEPLLWHYVRGYFDGDGHVTSRLDSHGYPVQVGFCGGSLEYMRWLHRFVRSHHAFTEDKPTLFKFTLSGPLMRDVVVPRLYENSTPDTRLARKYQRLKSLIDKSLDT